jgi:transposase
MDYFAGLDISMDETHVCVLDREGVVVRESKTESTAEAIAGELAKAPTCRRIVFETGRMAPILFHGLSQFGLPVVCVESRQAYQALKSLATHKTDRNDARGLAHLARTGFFKPVHVKSLPAHAVRSLISARKKLVGQRVTLENQIRGLAVVFGVRLPRALTAAFIDNALKASKRIADLSAAMRGLIAARTAVMTAVAAIDADIRRMTRASAAYSRLMTIPGVGQLTALAFVAAIDDQGVVDAPPVGDGIDEKDSTVSESSGRSVECRHVVTIRGRCLMTCAPGCRRLRDFDRDRQQLSSDSRSSRLVLLNSNVAMVGTTPTVDTMTRIARRLNIYPVPKTAPGPELPIESLLKAIPLMIDLGGRNLVHHREKLIGDRHRRAGLIAVDEEHHAARVAVDLNERGLVAVGQARRRQRIHRINAAKELPLLGC